MILTPAQIIELETLEQGIVDALLPTLSLCDPFKAAAWIAEQVEHSTLLQIAPSLQECPNCWALHNETAWRIPLSDPAYLPVTYADHGHCSQECQDGEAERAHADRYQSRDAS